MRKKDWYDEIFMADLRDWEEQGCPDDWFEDETSRHRPPYNSSPRQPRRHIPPDGTWARALFDAVGPERRDAVFRSLSRVLHPDTPTGDAELMRDLIAAREEMNRRRTA